MKLFIKIALIPFKVLGFVALPFLVLIRGSVYLYEHQGMGPWISLALAGTAVLLLLVIYLSFLSRKIFGKKKKKRSLKGKLILAGLLLVVYGGYTLLYLSGTNAKSKEVKAEYTSLHPFLRMAVSTFVLMDADMMVTDMSRTHADYKDMGLKTLKNSLHYEQEDGYVHAVDLRTNDRSEFRNSLLQLYFKLMGFNTLRHVGTEDHLHVSLMIRENPGAI